MQVVNTRTGEIDVAQIIVAVPGASSFTYAEATWTQQLPDWIASGMILHHYGVLNGSYCPWGAYLTGYCTTCCPQAFDECTIGINCVRRDLPVARRA